MKKLKRIFSLVLSLIMLLSVTIGFDFSTYAMDATGQCDENVDYTFDSSTGELCIYGNGSINNDAFRNITDIKSLVIDEGITGIGASAFHGCKELTSVSIPNSVKSIDDNAFFYCVSLTDITMSNSLLYIGKSAFFDCAGITSIIIPDSVSTIGEGAFHRVNNVEYHGDATGSPWEAKSINGYVDGYLVYNDSEKTQLLGCSTQATGVTIPKSVTSIGDYAFYECKDLISITIPDSVKNICNYAFMYSGLISLLIPNSVVSIGDYAFYECTKLESVSIGNNVTKIGSFAFYECSNLESVTIPNSVKNIGNSAFIYCSGLTSIVILNGLESIDSYAFADCVGVMSIAIPNSVSSIGSSAFYRVNNIEYYGSASSYSPWGAKALNGFIDGDLVYRDSAKTELLGCSVGSVEVTVPNSVTSIGVNAFRACSDLVTIIIPKSVIDIKDYAFVNCTELNDVYYTGSQDEWNDISIGKFNNSLTNATIHYDYAPITNHIPRRTVETIIEGDCETDGVYDVVIICELCGEEISRERRTTEATGHVFVCESNANGELNYSCLFCNEKHSVTLRELYLSWNDDIYNSNVTTTKYNDSSLYDVVTDGVINAKDYAYLMRMTK